jgi:hypothetical protein
MLPAHEQQLARHQGPSGQGPLGLLQVLARGVLSIELVERDVDAAIHPHQQVAEVVRHRAGQPTQHRQPLGGQRV